MRMIVIMSTKKLFSLLLIIFVSRSYGQVHVCDTFPASTGEVPPPPDLPSKFQTRIEVTFLENYKQSKSIRQFFDYDNRKAAINIQEKNSETRMIFDYEANLIHLVELNPTQEMTPPFGSPKLCVSISLENSPEFNHYFGVERINSSYIRPKSVYDILKFRNYPVTFQGTEIVRGIPCDSYISCQYDADLKSNFTVKYSFSRYNYSMANWNDKYSRVPVRAIFQGYMQLPNGTYEHFTMNYDYYDFIAESADSDAMITPPGVPCGYRKPTRPLPVNVKKRFQLSEEDVADSSITYLKDLTYDEEYQMVRLELRQFEKNDLTFYSLDPVRLIHDYNIGVAFGINLALGNCSIGPITNTTLEEDSAYSSNLTQSEFIIRLKSAASLLLLDKEYVYIGERFYSDIPTTSFLAFEKLADNSSLIIQYDFTRDDFEFDVFDQREKSVPVTILKSITNSEGYTSKRSNIYNFNTRRVNPRVFDVSQCFDSDRAVDTYDVQITFPFRDQATIEQVNQRESIETQLYLDILQVVHESFTRITRPKVAISESDGIIYVRFRILPNPPPLALFTFIPGKWVYGGSHSYQPGVETTEMCAAFCVEFDDCLSFDYNSDTKNCFLNRVHYSTGIVASNQNIAHYSRNTLNGFGSKPTYKVLDTLKREVQAANFAIELDDPKSNQKIRLVANKVDRVSMSQNNRPTSSANSFSRYDKKFDSKKFVNEKVKPLGGFYSADDCATACTDEQTFECKSFDYCFITNQCRLNMNAASDDPADYVEDYCSVYSQNDLFHYRPSGRVLVNKKDKNYKVDSIGECARKCDAETSIHCRSFNYCGNKDGTCYLSENHLADASSNDAADLTCQHFTRDYLADFTFTSASKQILDAEIVFSETKDLSTCALLCVTADGFNCHSMDYCAATKTCMLNSGYKKQSDLNNQTAGINVDSCNNYKREYFYTTSLKTNSKISDSSETVLTALSIAFSILSICAGIIGTQFIIKKKLLA